MKIRTTYPSFNISILESFRNAIGSSVDLKVIKDYEDIKEADLIAFPGGEDVNPRLYRARNTKSHGVNDNRDAREQFIYKHAVSLNKPMFGMCRGLQFLAVMLGNYLIQDIYSELEESHGGSHSIKYTVDSIVSASFDTVNSLHHQGLLVRLDGNDPNTRSLFHSGIYVTSVYGSIAESIESKNIIATQFHPEFMNSSKSRKFFELLAKWVEKPEFTFNVEDYKKLVLKATPSPSIEFYRTEDEPYYREAYRMAREDTSSITFSNRLNIVGIFDEDNTEEEEEE